MIKRINNFLSKDYCNNLIRLFENSSEKFKHGDNLTLDCKDDVLLNNLSKKFKIDLLKYPNTKQIVKWPTGSYMNTHLDSGDVYGIIFYLNDDYIGGETVIENKKIKPKTGNGVLFSNGKLYHSVTKIEKGNRYTLGIWYK